MANDIIGTIGKLGVGKSLYGVIWGYDGVCDGRPLFSNIRLNFKHIPLKTLEDITNANAINYYNKTGKNGRMILDELWKLADNRKCMGLLAELTDIVLIQSRKMHLDVYFTQQFLQIDPRIAFCVTQWIAPKVYPVKCSKFNPPTLLIVERCDGDYNELPPKRIKCQPYLNLFNSDENPYIIKDMVSPERIKAILERIKEEEQK